MKTKQLFYLSLIIIVYFVILITNAYIIKCENTLVRVIQEYLTLPILLSQLVILGVSIKFVMEDKFKVKTYSFWTFVLMFISSLCTFLSIILKIG